VRQHRTGPRRFRGGTFRHDSNTERVRENVLKSGTRLHDTDGRLLYHGTTRARPHPDNTSHSSDPARTGSDDPAWTDSGDRARPDGKQQAYSDGDDRACPDLGDPAHPDSTRHSSDPALTGSDDPAWTDGDDQAYPDSGSGDPACPNGGDQECPDGKQQAAGQRRPRPYRALQCRQPNASGPTGPQPIAPCPPRQADETARFPAARLRSWIAARDTTCRAPGCTAPARSCDIDHTTDHADGGATRHDNLGLLCRHHHRLKHDGGFHLDQPEPGHFRWTSPTGHVYDVAPDPP
jgi:hypothetical protein